MVGLIEDPDDISLADIREMAEAAEQGDIAVAIDLLEEVEAADSNADLDDEIDLPFYEDDRELAFGLGLMVGGVLQASETADRLHGAEGTHDGPTDEYGDATA